MSPKHLKESSVNEISPSAVRRSVSCRRAEEKDEAGSPIDLLLQENWTSRKEVIAIRQEVEWLRAKILGISPRELEELTAALLRALGYSTWVSPLGGDRGIDVLATPDALGLRDPRIKVQVKHRPNRRMPAPEIRELIGALRPGDRGLCVSTGGFSREARYEAERSDIPIRLVDLDELTLLILRHYDGFDSTGVAILPLQKIYWPVG